MVLEARIRIFFDFSSSLIRGVQERFIRSYLLLFRQPFSASSNVKVKKLYPSPPEFISKGMANLMTGFLLVDVESSVRIFFTIFCKIRSKIRSKKRGNWHCQHKSHTSCHCSDNFFRNLLIINHHP